MNRRLFTERLLSPQLWLNLIAVIFSKTQNLKSDFFPLGGISANYYVLVDTCVNAISDIPLTSAPIVTSLFKLLLIATTNGDLQETIFLCLKKLVTHTNFGSYPSNPSKRENLVPTSNQ
jgi:hypothetical protein